MLSIYMFLINLLYQFIINGIDNFLAPIEKDSCHFTAHVSGYHVNYSVLLELVDGKMYWLAHSVYLRNVFHK